MELDTLVDKIDALESKQAFQDDTIESLNTVIVQQQKDIEQLKLKLNMLQERIKQAGDLHSEISTEEPPPPHY